MDIVVYSKDNCPNCVIAKNLLESNGIKFRSYEIGKDIDMSDFKTRYPNVRAVPFILNGETAIGGLTELMKFI